MSKARSPREVCSTTIGIRGLILGLSSLAGGTKFRCGCLPLLLVGGPEALARLVQVGRDRLHLRRDPVERLPHPEVAAHAIGAAGVDELLDVVLALARLQELLA